MLFMCIETFKNQDAKAVYRRFRDQGRQMPDGLAFVGSGSRRISTAASS
jgi:hypothetical protein